MTETLIGFDYSQTPCVKITRDGKDPVTTVDTDYAAFYYNSKWAADVRVIFSDTQQPLGLGAFGAYFYPPGTGVGNYQWLADNYSINANSAAQRNYYRNSFFPDLVYSLPLHEVKPIRKTNGRFVQNGMIISYRGYEDRGTRRTVPDTAEWGWCVNFQWPSRPNVGVVNGIPNLQASPSTPSGSQETFRTALVVWNLPGDETPIQNGTPLDPVPGQESILIDSTQLKVAKPGFTASTATGTQLAFDSTYRPAKIIAANDIAIPAGVSSYTLPFSVPASSLVDVHYYIGDTIFYPNSPSDLNFGGESWLSGNQLNFNSAAACRARFMVYAFDNSSQTVGNNDVLRQTVIDGQDVVQFLRPGAGPNPTFSDIVLDSRWPCLQIIKQGVINVENGENQYVVGYEGSDDLFPFVKYTTIHGAMSDSGVTISKSVRQPKVAIGRLTRSGGVVVPLFQCGDSTYCRLTNTEARFFTHRGNPTWAFWRTSADYTNNTITREYDPAPLYAIRYYIFGLPKR